MAVEEHRRIALHRAAAECWGEEVADTLMDSIAPAGHELATRQDIEAILAAVDAMDERWDERCDTRDERLSTMDERWQAEGKALRAEMTGAIDRRVGDAITTRTRILMVLLFVALVAIAGLAFGLN